MVLWIANYDPSIIDRVVAAAQLSGIYGLAPKMHDTSDYREGGPYHGSWNAVDFGNEGTDYSQHDALSAWLVEHFGEFSLEIIHTSQNGSGFYWKNGSPVDGPSFYGQDTVNAHYDHVHWAINDEGLTYGLQKFWQGVADLANAAPKPGVNPMSFAIVPITDATHPGTTFMFKQACKVLNPSINWKDPIATVEQVRHFLAANGFPQVLSTNQLGMLNAELQEVVYNLALASKNKVS